jgi:hypothetical protein
VKYRPARSRRWWIRLIAGITILVAVFVAGIGFMARSYLDNIGNPGQSATGSGPCGSSEAINLYLSFADGTTANACTGDRPSCGNELVDPSDTGQGSKVLEFTLHDQLRSPSRRYALFLRLDSALPAETGSINLPLVNSLYIEGQGLPGFSGKTSLSRALVDIRPRDPDGYPSTSASGSLTISSSNGVVQGQIDGELSGDQGGSPAHIAGSFACHL